MEAGQTLIDLKKKKKTEKEKPKERRNLSEDSKVAYFLQLALKRLDQ